MDFGMENMLLQLPKSYKDRVNLRSKWCATEKSLTEIACLNQHFFHGCTHTHMLLVSKAVPVLWILPMPIGSLAVLNISASKEIFS